MAWRAQNIRIQRDPVLSDVVRPGIVMIPEVGKRITALEQKLAPREAVTDEQSADISAKVMAIATEMAELDPSKNHYQGIFGEMHRRFRVISYKNIRQSQYQNVLDFLDTYSGMA